MVQEFSCEIYEVFKNTFFIEHLWLLLMSQPCFQLYNIPSCTMNLVPSFINDFLFTLFQQKNEIKKGKYPNGICFNDLFDVMMY